MTAMPRYIVKENRRIRSVRLKLSAHDGLVVVVPEGFDQGRIPGMIRKKKAWIDRATERIEEQRKFLEPEPPGKVPERIMLRSVADEWSVDYRPTDAPWVAVVERGTGRLLVYGDTDNVTACKQALKRWLARKAHEYLVPWLGQLSKDVGLPFNQTLVKSQRTRWASCSRHRTISINHKLLFLPSHLVRYVFLHELCHTAVMNHSKKFWTLVAVHEPKYKALDDELRRAWRYVPAWIDRG